MLCMPKLAHVLDRWRIAVSQASVYVRLQHQLSAIGAGGVGGLLGAMLAVAFFVLHRTLKRASMAMGLHEHRTPVLSGKLPYRAEEFLFVHIKDRKLLCQAAMVWRSQVQLVGALWE